MSKIFKQIAIKKIKIERDIMNKKQIVIYQIGAGAIIAFIILGILFLCAKPVDKFIHHINTDIEDSTTVVGPEHNLLATITGYSTYTDSEPTNQILLVDGNIHNVMTFQDVTKYRINFSNNESMNINQSEFNRYTPGTPVYIHFLVYKDGTIRKDGFSIRHNVIIPQPQKENKNSSYTIK